MFTSQQIHRKALWGCDSSYEEVLWSPRRRKLCLLLWIYQATRIHRHKDSPLIQDCTVWLNICCKRSEEGGFQGHVEYIFNKESLVTFIKSSCHYLFSSLMRIICIKHLVSIIVTCFFYMFKTQRHCMHSHMKYRLQNEKETGIF